MKVFVTKANGYREVFRVEKLRKSLQRAGVDKKMIDSIVAHIEGELVDGMTTTEIYRHAFSLLKEQGPHPTAARYSLKRAVMSLGPSGFPFEKFLARLFEAQGYTAETGIVVAGRCTKHEVDVIARKDGEIKVCEAKFHNTPGFKTDTKVALYVHSRFHDLQESRLGGEAGEQTNVEYMLITNTKFTRNARDYARCVGDMNLVSWTYPRGRSLEQMIEQSGLHPLTCLTTLSKNDQQQLMKQGHVLCSAVKDNHQVLNAAGISGNKADAVLKEAKQLCVPRELAQ